MREREKKAVWNIKPVKERDILKKMANNVRDLKTGKKEHANNLDLTYPLVSDGVRNAIPCAGSRRIKVSREITWRSIAPCILRKTLDVLL